MSEQHPPEDNDPFRHIIEYKMDSRLLDDGMVGVLIAPFNFNVNPKGRDLMEFLEAQEDFEVHERWGSLLPMAISRGRPFKLNEWELIWPLVGVVKHQDGEFYVPSDVLVGDREKGTFLVARKIQPDSEGRIALLWNSYWWSQEEIDVQRELDEKFAAFYVLVEGKSEQERQEEPGGARKLEPRLAEAT